MTGLPGGTSDKEPTCPFRRHKRRRFSPWVGKIPWRRARQPTPVFLPGEPHGRGAWRAAVRGVARSGTRLKCPAHRERRVEVRTRGRRNRCMRRVVSGRRAFVSTASNSPSVCVTEMPSSGLDVIHLKSLWKIYMMASIR